MWIEYWRFALEKGHKKTAPPECSGRVVGYVCTPSGVAFETKGFSVILTYFNITGGGNVSYFVFAAFHTRQS